MSQALDWGSIKFAEPLATLSTVLAAFVFASIVVLLLLFVVPSVASSAAVRRAALAYPNRFGNTAAAFQTIEALT